MLIWLLYGGIYFKILDNYELIKRTLKL
jgi:hypothetical protein